MVRTGASRVASSYAKQNRSLTGVEHNEGIIIGGRRSDDPPSDLRVRDEP